jgi:uncharacterized protein
VILAHPIPDAIVAIVSLFAGAVAAVTGFGIGSILTPVLAVRFDTRAAIAIVSVPHLAASLLRFATSWQQADRRTVMRFASFSMAGGLAGALVGMSRTGPGDIGLQISLGALLILGGLGALCAGPGIDAGRKTTAVAGIASGFFGGLVGSQGPIRSAAMLSLDISKESFVATAMATAIAVDVARIPVYLYADHAVMAHASQTILLATAGVLVGTFCGKRLLSAVPVPLFRRAVAILVFALGAAVLATAFRK